MHHWKHIRPTLLTLVAYFPTSNRNIADIKTSSQQSIFLGDNVKFLIKSDLYEAKTKQRQSVTRESAGGTSPMTSMVQ